MNLTPWRSRRAEPAPSTVAAEPPTPEPMVGAKPPKSKLRYRRRLVFWHVSTHRERWQAFAFARAVLGVAEKRDNVEVIPGDENGQGYVVTERDDGLFDLDILVGYGPVIGGCLQDGERILRKARTVQPPVEELPLTVIDSESERLADPVKP